MKAGKNLKPLDKSRKIKEVIIKAIKLYVHSEDINPVQNVLDASQSFSLKEISDITY